MKEIENPNDIKPGILLKNGKSGYYALVFEVREAQDVWFNCIKAMFFGDEGHVIFDCTVEELFHHNWAICNRHSEALTIRNIDSDEEDIDNLAIEDNFGIESPF